jgi:hypothetical protein
MDNHFDDEKLLRRCRLAECQSQPAKGAGLIFVLALPVLNANSGFWISVVVGASIILAAPIAWWMAPRLRARYGRPRIAASSSR